ncbi:MAG: hypothetical protein QOD99_2039 [Chthoniobacter sp.]|jgi:MFS family permease|nr:hypothetical protein [Chthoniobacter sp.]
MSEPDKLAFETPRADRPASAEPAVSQRRSGHDPYAAFRFRAYRLYALGNLASIIGRQMLAVAVEWEIYQRTHSAAALGLVGLALALPILLFAIPAGHYADIFSRKKIMLITQMITAFGSAGLALLSISHADLRLIYVLLFVTGTARAFGGAARGALLPNLVPTEHFGSAVTWNSSTFEFGTVIGPALGGFLIAHFGFPLVYFLDAFSALSFFALLLPIRAVQTPAPPAGKGLDSLFTGIAFVIKNKIVLATMTLDMFAVLFGGAVALLPIFADQILHCGPVGLGWLRAAPSFGSLAMGMTLAHSSPMKLPGKTLLRAVIGFGLATILFGMSRWFPLSIFLLALTGACDSVSVVVRHTLVQLLTPDAMRGRVSAVNNVFIGSSNELGAFESGMTAAWLGPVASVIGGGLATIGVVLLVRKKWPEVCRIGPFASIRAASNTT